MVTKCDFHSHSRLSDGVLEPEDVVKRAATNLVTHLALTDHDTTAGLKRAAKAAADAGLHLINGVELSCDWASRTIHVVGLGFDAEHPKMMAYLNATQAIRRERAVTMGAKLDKATGQKMYQATFDLAGHDQITRTHFAKALINAGLVKDFNRAFKRYLGRGKSAYVASSWLTLAEAVDAIVEAGGVAVLAHPTHYQLGANKLKSLVGDFAKAGGEAIEVYIPNLKPNDALKLKQLAEHFELEASIGSDFHDPAHGWRDLGKLPLPSSEKRPLWNRWVIE